LDSGISSKRNSDRNLSKLPRTKSPTKILTKPPPLFTTPLTPNKTLVSHVLCLAGNYLLLSASPSSLVTLSSPQLLDDFKSRLKDKSQYNSKMFDTIYNDVNNELHVLYDDFCWEFRKKLPELAKFSGVLQNEDDPHVLHFHETCVEKGLFNHLQFLTVVHKLRKQGAKFSEEEIVARTGKLRINFSELRVRRRFLIFRCLYRWCC